jgi:hypothetical protein
MQQPYTPEDNGPGDYQVEDERESIGVFLGSCSTLLDCRNNMLALPPSKANSTVLRSLKFPGASMVPGGAKSS